MYTHDSKYPNAIIESTVYKVCKKKKMKSMGHIAHRRNNMYNKISLMESIRARY